MRRSESHLGDPGTLSEPVWLPGSIFNPDLSDLDPVQQCSHPDVLQICPKTYTFNQNKLYASLGIHTVLREAIRLHLLLSKMEKIRNTTISMIRINLPLHIAVNSTNKSSRNCSLMEKRFTAVSRICAVACKLGSTSPSSQEKHRSVRLKATSRQSARRHHRKNS